MPRGRFPTDRVAVTSALTGSIIDTSPDPSLLTHTTYALSCPYTLAASTSKSPKKPFIEAKPTSTTVAAHPVLAYLKSHGTGVPFLAFSAPKLLPPGQHDASTTGKSGRKADPRSAESPCRGRACEISSKGAPASTGSGLPRPPLAFPRLLSP